MRKKEEKLLIKLSLLIGDAILIATSFLLSYWLRFNIRIVPVKFGVPPLLEYLKLIPVAVLLWIFIFTKLKVYELKLERISVEFYQIIKGVSLGMGILIIISFFYRSFEYSRIVAILLWIISTLLLICFRILMYFIKKSLYKKGYGISNVLIVGAGKIGNMIYEKISQNSSYGYKIVGFLDDNVTGEKILGKTNELSSVIQKYKIDEVIFALPFRAREKIFNLVLETESNYAKAYVIPDFFELISKKIDIEKFEGVPLLKFKEIPLSGYNIIIKRMFDLTFSILFVITFSIVYLIIAILIKIT
jgi:FlaA1/EpsC-like NDP-sugar epimerase